MYGDVRRSCHLTLYSVYLHRAFLIIKFKVHAVSYRPRFFLFTYGPSMKCMCHKLMGKKRGSITYSADEENKVSKIISIISMNLIRSTGKGTS